jgi:hypothetical protein
LRLAERPRLFLPYWSETILDEVRRTHTQKLGWEDRLAHSFQAAVREAFPEAIVTGFEPLMQLETVDQKDRHVVAAALKCPCPLILTFNLRHFRAEQLEPLGLRASHPDDYLVILYELDPRRVAASLGEMAGRHKMEMEDLLIRLGRVIPKFASRALDDLGK